MKIAGWLAMASAFLTLPLVFISFKLEGRADSEASAIQTIIQTSGTFLFVAILLFLKRLLHSIFNFRGTEWNINLMLITGVITGILSVAALHFAPFKESIGSAVIVMMVLQGIVQIQFGYRLLKLPDNLAGMLQPFCYANMATGIFLVSIALIPLSILASAISDLMLGTIFFNISRLPRGDDSGR